MCQSKPKVFCQRNVNNGFIDFYLKVDRGQSNGIYLFTTDYFSYNVYDTYIRGRRTDEMYGNTSKVRQQKIRERILRSLKYIEQEYSIDIFERSGKKFYSKKERRYDLSYEMWYTKVIYPNAARRLRLL